MLQIIGWMACVYMLAKGIEFVINPQNRQAEKREGEDWYRIKPSALFTAWGLWVSAVTFFFLLNHQASQMPGAQPTFSNYGECLKAANTLEQMKECDKYPAN